MATSTASITVPARHRAEEAPTWWVHVLFALLLLLPQRVVWDMRWIAYRGRRHLVVLALAAAVIALLVVGLLAPLLP